MTISWTLCWDDKKGGIAYCTSAPFYRSKVYTATYLCAVPYHVMLCLSRTAVAGAGMDGELRIRLSPLLQSTFIWVGRHRSAAHLYRRPRIGGLSLPRAALSHVSVSSLVSLVGLTVYKSVQPFVGRHIHLYRHISTAGKGGCGANTMLRFVWAIHVTSRNGHLVTCRRNLVVTWRRKRFLAWFLK